MFNPAAAATFVSHPIPDGAISTGSAGGLASMPLASSNLPVATAAFSMANDADDEDLMPWDEDGWVPTTKSGKQKAPNAVRNELQRYIDECKADGTSNQTQIMKRMGVNSNTFRRFMNPKTYKDQWSATQNGTYWAAAKLLEQVNFEKKLAMTTSGSKRKSNGEDTVATPKKSKIERELEYLRLIQRVNAIGGVSENHVYDSCPEVIAKIKAFLLSENMTKAKFLLALGGINSNSLGKFLSSKHQDGCGNIAYRSAYVFFEKLRILEGKPKSAARLRNEMKHPGGFPLEKERAAKYKWLLGPY